MNRFLLVGVAAIIASANLFSAEHTKDTTDEVKKALKDDKAIIVDVREESEWKDGHLKLAKLLPLSDLKAGVKAELLKEKLGTGKVVYLHCGSGRRVLTAAEILKKEGYDVRPLKEGYADLVKAGFESTK